MSAEEKWNTLFSAVFCEAHPPVPAKDLVDRIIRDEKWDCISGDAYHVAVDQLRRESTLPEEQFNKTLEAVPRFARLVQVWNKDFGRIQQEQVALLGGCVSTELPPTPAVISTFDALYSGLTSARKRILFGRQFDLNVTPSDKNIRPIDGEQVDADTAREMDVLFRGVPDKSGALRSYMDDVVKNAQILKREQGRPIHELVFFDVMAQHVLRNKHLSIANHNDSAFVFQAIAPKFVDIRQMVRNVEQFVACHQTASARPNPERGRGIGE